LLLLGWRCQITCASKDTHPELGINETSFLALLKLWNDSEVEKVFQKHAEKGQTSASLPGHKLRDALRELGVAHGEQGGQPAEAGYSLDDFKRIARQPSETELWMQMMPMASMLARSFRKMTLKELEAISKDEVSAGFQAFAACVKAMFEQRLEKLMNQTKKLQNLPSSNDNDSKFGGVLEGGDVGDFHRGLADRLGESRGIFILIF